MQEFWEKISHLGLNKTIGINSPEQKRLIFFNQVLFIGIFATLSQIAFVWPFIGVKSLVFIPAILVLGFALWLNSQQKFSTSI